MYQEKELKRNEWPQTNQHQRTVSTPPIQLTSAIGNQAMLQLIGLKKQEKKPNITGTPDQTKENFEKRSEFSFDDVKIHYNSEKPTQPQALAYTQGNQVYVAHGQEKHLGHAVQQKQSRVCANTSVNGMAVNNEDRLKKEADEINNIKFDLSLTKNDTGMTNATCIIQKFPMDYNEFITECPNIKNFFDQDNSNRLWRFTNSKNEKVPKYSNETMQHASGEFLSASIKPRSFAANLSALISSSCLQGDRDLLEIMCSVNYLVCLEPDKATDCIIETATINQLTLFETECILCTKDKEADLEKLSGITIYNNPFKTKNIKTKDSKNLHDTNDTDALKNHFLNKMEPSTHLGITPKYFNKLWDLYKGYNATKGFSEESPLHYPFLNPTVDILKELIEDKEHPDTTLPSKIKVELETLGLI